MHFGVINWVSIKLALNLCEVWTWNRSVESWALYKPSYQDFCIQWWMEMPKRIYRVSATNFSKRGIRELLLTAIKNFSTKSLDTQKRLKTFRPTSIKSKVIRSVHKNKALCHILIGQLLILLPYLVHFQKFLEGQGQSKIHI